MDFNITDEDRQFGATFEKFAQDKLAKRAPRADEEGNIPKENWGDLKEIGFFQLFYPEPFGISPTWVQRAMAEESLAKACASTFLSAGATIGLCGAPIYHFGTD